MSSGDFPDAMYQLVHRARLIFGTVATIQARIPAGALIKVGALAHLYQLLDRTLHEVWEIEYAMSLHNMDSDLASLARIRLGETVVLSKHTVNVLRLAKFWYQVSAGVLDPVLTRTGLSTLDISPVFQGLDQEFGATLRDIKIVDAVTVFLGRPICLDLSSFSRGYALDHAISSLAKAGLDIVLIDVGGDLRASGAWDWPTKARCLDGPPRVRNISGLRSLRDAALSRSTGIPTTSETILSGQTKSTFRWDTCTVQARDSVTAGALTKWGLLAGHRSQRLERILRAHGASMWRA